ncbi:hypothetical protein KXW73_003801, partial [Aspergillus fumigatus]
ATAPDTLRPHSGPPRRGAARTPGSPFSHQTSVAFSCLFVHDLVNTTKRHCVW